MATVKIVCTDVAVGTIDNIPVTPGTHSFAFDNERRGGGATPVVNMGGGKVFTFTTQITTTGLTIAKAFAMLKTLENVTLSPGGTGGLVVVDVVGPAQIEMIGDGTLQAQITVTGNAAP